MEKLLGHKNYKLREELVQKRVGTYRSYLQYSHIHIIIIIALFLSITGTYHTNYKF